MQNTLPAKKEFDYDHLQKDALSTLFERNRDHSERKCLGQFFTHKSLVQYILNKLNIVETSTVLDPSCGAGAFLKQIQHNTNNLYGIDIDQAAVNACIQNLNYKCNNIIRENSIKTFNLKKSFPEIYVKGGFDFIIGNPPFQNLKKYVDYDPCKYINISCGVVNSATLMIMESLKLLKKDGYLAFVLPKNILRVETFNKFRQYLLANTNIISITDLGHFFKDVRGDQIILIIQNKKPNKIHSIDIEILDKKQNFDTIIKYQIQQKQFKNFDIFPVFYNNNLFQIYDKFKIHEENLNDICKNNIFRGISIDINKHTISNHIIGQTSTQIFRGASIERFGIKKIFYTDDAILKTSKINRLLQDKIILQNLCSKEGGICATLSTSKELNIDTVTNIIPNKYNFKYILGILNSRVANIFLIYLTFLHSNFAMHTDKPYIGKLPIAKPTKEQECKVVIIVDKLLSIKDKFSSDFYKYYNELNDVIYDIYNFNPIERKIIEDTLREGMSKKQNG